MNSKDFYVLIQCISHDPIPRTVKEIEKLNPQEVVHVFGEWDIIALFKARDQREIIGELKQIPNITKWRILHITPYGSEVRKW